MSNWKEANIRKKKK